MADRLRGKLTYANVVSTLCLFLLLGGGAYAATHLSKNSVGTRQLKNNAVNSAKVKNHSLRAADFTAGQIPAGPRGSTGAQGVPGISGLQRVFASSAIDSSSPKSANATCPAGKRVIGSGGQHVGGVTGTDPNGLTDVVIDQIAPSDENTVPGNVLVSAFEEEPTNASWSVNAFALCANVP